MSKKFEVEYDPELTRYIITTWLSEDKYTTTYITQNLWNDTEFMCKAIKRMMEVASG